jgi:uncharacterized protein (TIGR03435 family)
VNSRHLSLIFLLAVSGLVSSVFAQDKTGASTPVVPGGPNRLAFEVTSVKPLDPDSRPGPSGNPQDGLNETSNLEFFVTQAYGVHTLQVVGGPDWMQSDPWQIEAKTTGPAPMADRVLMLQTLLADRFKLVMHTETRMLPVYSLVVAKGGAKMQQAEPGARPYASLSRTLISGTMTPRTLANMLTSTTGRLITDNTGLSGFYHVKMEWVPEDSDGGASLFAAIEDLGLKLQAGKAPVQVYVVDHVERPTPN